MTVLRLAVCAVAASLSIASAACASAAELWLLHWNDLHGFLRPAESSSPDGRRVRLPGAAVLAGKVAEFRRQHPGQVVVLDAGDSLAGTPLSNEAKGRPAVEWMNLVGVDAWALGNHEFDWGPAVLAERVGEFRGKALCANVKDAKGSLLPGVSPSTVIERAGAKLFVVGVVSPETPRMVRSGMTAGLSFEEAEPAVAREIRRAPAGTTVVVLSHLGVDADIRLAEQVPGIDLIVGGHSHTPLFEPIRVRRAKILQAGCYGRFLGVQRLVVDDADGAVRDYNRKWALRGLRSSDREDPASRELIARWWAPLAKKYAKVAGRLAAPLSRGSGVESSLGAAVCDCFRELTAADVAFMNPGGLRNDLPAGEVTYEAIYSALPFDNHVVVVEMSGAELLETLEAGGAARRGPLHVSGLSVHYDLSRPEGERVVALSVAGAPVDSSRTYKVATLDFLTDGAGPAPLARARKVPGRHAPLARDAFADYLARRSPLPAPAGGRIVIEGAPAPDPTAAARP